MPNSLQLYQLQEIDSQLASAQRRLKEIAANLVETEAYKVAKANLKSADITLKKSSSVVTDLELEVKGLQQKIKQHETRLYGGKLVNPKEASSLQDDIAATKRWLAKREEDLLEAMITLEDNDTLQKQRQQTFEAEKTQWQTEQSDLLTEQKTLQTQVVALTDKRAQQIKFMEPDGLTIYEKLRRQKGGVAVTGVENDTCKTCGVMLAYHLIRQAEDDTQLSFCENCGRIIYLL